MTTADNQDQKLLAELEDLRARLADAEETLRAIQSGEVDALVVQGPEGPSVYTLKGEERTYRILVESVNDGALTLTPDGTIMYANSAFARMIGVSLQHIIASTFDALVVEEYRESLAQLLHEGIKYPSRRELSLKRAHDGEPLPVYVSVSPMTVDEVKALSVVVTDLADAKRTERELMMHREHLEELVRERTEELEATNEELRAITDEVQSMNAQLKIEFEERKSAEETVRQSEARLRATLESTPDEIWIVDAEGRVVLLSDSVRENLGISSDRLPDVDAVLSQLLILRPDGSPRPREEAILLRSLRGEVITREEEMVRNVATGELRWREVNGSPIRNREGKITGAVAVVRDITERKKTERALAESESFFRGIYDSTQDAIVVIDNDGKYVSANPAVKEIFGLPQDQLVGRDISEFVSGEFSIAEAWKQLGETGAFVAEHKIIAADGTEKTVETRATADMLPGQHLAVIHDVTDEAMLRDQLKRQVTLLQRALLPPAPRSVEGYAVASAYIPAYAGEEIGGDFYDLFRTVNGKIGVMIGDVSGKGIEAAALAATTRSTVRAFAYETSSCGRALGNANALLASQQFGAYEFVTAFLGLFDPETGDLCYCGAGHPPAMIHCPGGVVGLLNTGGAPLGVTDTGDFDEFCTRLDPGDKLIVYTDGVSEARRGSRLFGTEGIERVLEEHGGDSPEELVTKILDAAREWAEGMLRDDTAIVIIQRKP